MNRNIFFVLISILVLAAFGFRYAAEKRNQPLQVVSREVVLKNKLIIQCSPDWGYLDADSLANGIGVLPGWGNYHWNIATKSDSALLYFNQGINLYYAFHIIESMASFKKAQQFDPANAMIYWGQALAYGPNINDYIYAATPEAFAAAQKATSLMGNCSAKEKALITAMATRYTQDTTVSRATLNELYTDAMKNNQATFGDDADINTLYADAIMLQHPWDYWKHNGEAQPWTTTILTTLEKVLANYPEHPGANHYYIHSIEASGNPERALASADRLGKLMPGVSHMVHMPSHIYIRSGNYKQGSFVNEQSVKGYNTYLNLYPDVQNNVPLYLIHNLHMQSACAMMNADYAYSNKSSMAASTSFDTSFLSMPAPWGTFAQYVYMTPWISNIRFGKWDNVIATEKPNDHHTYSIVLWHWAKGIAFAEQNKLANAVAELTAMQDKMKAADLLVRMEPFNAPADAAKVAANILAGIIAGKENNFTKAIQLLTAAVAMEDALIYNEPRDWLLPARQYLGAALLKAGQSAKAGLVFKEDLKQNPHNHWALDGLYRALLQQKKVTEAAEVKKQFDKAFDGADITPGVAAF